MWGLTVAVSFCIASSPLTSCASSLAASISSTVLKSFALLFLLALYCTAYAIGSMKRTPGRMDMVTRSRAKKRVTTTWKSVTASILLSLRVGGCRVGSEMK